MGLCEFKRVYLKLFHPERRIERERKREKEVLTTTLKSHLCSKSFHSICMAGSADIWEKLS